MPSLRDIKRRIKGIKNIQQITKAMQMVAAAKVKKAQEKVTQFRDYSEKINSIFHHIITDIKREGIKDPLLETRELKNVGVILLTSDKGLCGSYNTNVIKYFLKQVSLYQQQNLNVKAWVIGSKGINFFKLHGGLNIIGCRNCLPTIPTYIDAQEIVESVIKEYKNGLMDKIVLFYTKFISMIKYEPQELQLLPIIPEEKTNTINTMYIFEPSCEVVVKKLLPMYLETQVYQSLLDAAASELASRMTAMNTATQNASELLEQITLIYNKARQSSITKEILEVVSGAEALK